MNNKTLREQAYVTISYKDFEDLKHHKIISDKKVDQLRKELSDSKVELQIARQFIKYFARYIPYMGYEDGSKALTNLKHYYPGIYDQASIPEPPIVEDDNDE